MTADKPSLLAVNDRRGLYSIKALLLFVTHLQQKGAPD